MEYKKIEPQINDFVGDNVKKLAQIFPSAVKDGQVDFQALKEELGQFEEVDSEKYELTWAGKQNAKKIAQEDVYGKTLKFIPEESVNADTTENLYIEGDNLEVLKLLRQNYYGAIKMIYIDPPYNTGNDFVYKDDFVSSKELSDIEEGNLGEFGDKYIINTKSKNRYHANWLNMMYPRLKVAKDLLKNDGVIFISIDSNEVNNLKKICNEIFGEDAHIVDLIWQKKTGASDAKGIASVTEYILVYTKTSQYYETTFTKNKESYDLKRYRYTDEYESTRGPYYVDNLDRGGLQYSDSLNYGIECPDGTITYPNGRDCFEKDGWIWKWSKPKIEWARKNNFLEFRKSNTKKSGWAVCYKNYLNVDNENKPIERAAPHKNLITDVLNANAAKTMKEIFGCNLFDYSKPVELVMKLISFVNCSNEIVLDFFSGSASTAHAIIQCNALDNGKRKFIMVQIPEQCIENSIANKNGYKNICDIGKDRIRKVAETLKLNNICSDKVDTGFKVFRLGDTNIKWLQDMQTGNMQLSANELNYTADLVDFKYNSNDLDIVYELMLKQKDVPLSHNIELLVDIGERTYLYGNSYLICLDINITKQLIDKLSQLNPLPIKFIFRDSAFGDDIALKDETFRRLKALIEKNSGTSKKAYTVEFI